MSYDNFFEIINAICRKSPLQKKKIGNSLLKKDEEFFEDAEKFSQNYMGYLESQKMSLDYAIDAYLNLCENMMKSQVKFMRTGMYPVGHADDVSAKIYNNETEMKSYMIGLAISQFLWGTHYDIYKFFGKYIKQNSKQILSYLEIGPGHGLFIKEAMNCLDPNTNFSIVDISPISIEITKSILNYFGCENRNVFYHNIDMLKLALDERYDFIAMGEVLEHVSFPEKLLVKLKDLLSANGKAFISTCVNCPAMDHVYHFKKISEVREMIDLCGLFIEDDLVLPSEELSWDQIECKKVTVNYCAILKSKRN